MCDTGGSALPLYQAPTPWEQRSMPERYTSYWNAYLCVICPFNIVNGIVGKNMKTGKLVHAHMAAPVASVFLPPV